MLNIEQSRTAEAVERIRSVSLRTPLRRAAPGTISLAIGEPDFDTPLVVRNAVVDALSRGATHYEDQRGLPELRMAIAAHESRRGRQLTAGDIQVTHGGSAGLAASILGLVDPGDVVAVEDPTYSLYADLVAMAGGTVVTYGRTQQGRLDADSVARAVRGARMLVVCQPSNPTGAIMTETDWEVIEEATALNQTVVLSDEAYSNLVYDGQRFVSVLDRPGLADRAVLCQTFSKKYAMTGFRIGYLVAPPDLLGATSLVHRTFNGSVNTAVQHGALAALTTATAEADHMLAAYTQRRAVMGDALGQVPGLNAARPEGAFYFFCRYDDARTSVQFAAAAADAGVVVRPGREFGDAGEGAIRLSFAVALQDIQEGIEKLASVLS